MRPLPAISYIKNCTKLNKFLGSSQVLSKMHRLYIRVNSYSLIHPSRSSSTSQIHWSTSGLLYGKFNSVKILMTSFLSNLSLGLQLEKRITDAGFSFIPCSFRNFHWLTRLYRRKYVWKSSLIFRLLCFGFTFRTLVPQEIFIGPFFCSRSNWSSSIV